MPTESVYWVQALDVSLEKSTWTCPLGSFRHGPCPPSKNILQWITAQEGHLTRIDCALDDRQASVPLSYVTQAAEVGQCISRADRVQVPSGEVAVVAGTGKALS